MEVKIPVKKKAKEKFDKIIKSADQEFYEYGYEKASIANITRNADVAVGTFYLYFEDKLSLYHYILFDYQSRIKNYQNERIKGCKTRKEKERMGLIAWLEFINENPHAYNIIWQSLAIDKTLFIDYYSKFKISYEKRLTKDEDQITNINKEDLSLMLMGISTFLGLKSMLNNETKLSQEEIENTANSIISILETGLFKKSN